MMGSEKGKVAEREVAAMLEAWWSPLEPGCRFIRTPQSGGWHSADVRAEFRACADIMTTAHRFPFAVESKRREGWAEKNLLAGRRSPVWGWWRQTLREAAEAGLEPLLLFRKNRRPWWAMVRHEWAKLGNEHLFFSSPVAMWDHGPLPGVAANAASHPILFRASQLVILAPARVALAPQPGLR